jgi:hypothetical protein
VATPDDFHGPAKWVSHFVHWRRSLQGACLAPRGSRAGYLTCEPHFAHTWPRPSQVLHFLAPLTLCQLPLPWHSEQFRVS